MNYVGLVGLDLVWLHGDPVNVLGLGNTKGLCREQEQALPQLLCSPHPAPPGQ